MRCPVPSNECWMIKLSWKQMIGIHRDPTSCSAAQLLVGIDMSALSFCSIFRLSLGPCFLFWGPAAWFSRVLPCLLSFLFFDILKTFSMLTFSLFHYTAHVLTTPFRVSCLICVSSSDWSFSVSPVCALSRILLNSRILTRTHHFPGPLFSLCVPWTNSTQLPLCLLWEFLPADFLWVFLCRSPLCPWSVGELRRWGIAMWSGCQIYLPTGLAVGGWCTHPQCTLREMPPPRLVVTFGAWKTLKSRCYPLSNRRASVFDFELSWCFLCSTVGSL